MASLNCFRNSWRKKKDKGDDHSADKEKIDVKTLHVKREHLQTYSETTELRSSSISVTVSVKVSNHDSPVSADKDETLTSNEEKCRDKDDDVFEMFTGGHVSDPGSGKPDFWASPKLKRSCSNLAMRRRNISSDLENQLPYPKCRSYEKLNEMFGEDCVVGDAATSPVSIRTNFSADKVILKKHSSSQILPSRSRKLWWKLFLWSHRNLHRAAVTAKPQPCAFNQHGGYSSDTVEPSNRLRLTQDSTNIKDKCKMDSNNNMWDGLYGVSGMWPQNQWVAFPTDSSPLERVNEWVRQVSILQPPLYEAENDHHSEDGTLTSPPRGGSSRLPPYPEEISHANSVIRSLNSGSSVAHITGIGLKAIPSISHFSSLRSLNLSSNFLGHITPGSLPKGLHILNLSRNKITTIECLRDLTRLRVLDLSYNRISRIGQGLSNCTLIKELYLAGNKISVVEGLHRLLKLTVLDLSFNKITTAKSLGQLVANYNSLIALNILGNPIQSNIGDEQLRKTICSLLTKLALLNKQPVNTQKAREIRGDANAKAALVSDSWHTRRKRVVRRGGSSKHRSKSHPHHHDHILKD